jgi:hypothetical protein
MAYELGIPSTFIETNSFWCRDDETTREKLIQLRNSGLDGMLISVNPFILDQIPFERTERALKIGKEIFGGNTIVYQEIFYHHFKKLNIKGTLSFEKYLQNDPQSLMYAEVLPNGRAALKLGYLYKKYPAKNFFDESCRDELTRGWHMHIDNYCNYMTGYCGGISLGDGRDIDSICRGIDLSNRPILKALLINLKQIFELGSKEFDYRECEGGYISKCHLCLDIRKHIVQKTDKFKELKPREFYHQLK